MTKWEYRVEKLPDDTEALRLMGHSGWEAVAVWTTLEGQVKVLLKCEADSETNP